MSNMQQQRNPSQTQGHAQAKTEEWIQSAKNTTNSGQSAQDANDQAGFFQQTGEKMVHMAQGAVDGVKNTLGMGESNK